MKLLSAQEAFERRVESSGYKLEDLVPESGVRLMVEFYEQQRFDGCVVDEDGDMLLFQWGKYDDHVNLDITRQLMDGFEDENIWQLHLVFLYPPVPALDGIEPGNRWCHTPVDVPGFREFIVASQAYARVGSLKPRSVMLSLDRAG